MTPPATVPLFDLLEHIRRVLALNYTEALWVTAEIGQMSRSRGHLYLDLVQKGAEPDDELVAQVPAVIWQRQYQKLRIDKGLLLDEVLQEGRELRLLVRVDFHERYGLKLQIEDLDTAFALGQIELRRRQTIQTLDALGLLERNRSLPLPAVLQRIAVISSEGAAGFQDFREQLRANAFGYQFDCTFFNAAVQGKNAETEILQALEQVAARRERYDGAVVLRGGGARLDLAAFDRLELCKTAATLPVPLFTGIGHDVDESVLDRVAHTALKTPTAVADFLIQHNYIFENRVFQLAGRLHDVSAQHLKIRALELAGQESALRWNAQAHTRQAAQQLRQLEGILPDSVVKTLQQAAQRLEQIDSFCAALHPEATLRRGYSLTLKNGRALRRAADAQPGDTLHTRLADGEIVSEVKKE